MTDDSKMLPRSKPPACPSCRTAAHVRLESSSDDAKVKVWRCTACEVRWDAALTPRSER